MTKAGARRPKKSAKKAAVRKKATRKAAAAKRTSSKPRAPEAVAAESAQPSELDALLPEGKLYYRIGEVAKITHVKPHVKTTHADSLKRVFFATVPSKLISRAVANAYQAWCILAVNGKVRQAASPWCWHLRDQPPV